MFICGNTTIQQDFDNNTPLAKYVLSLRAPLAVEHSDNEELGAEGADDSDAEDDQEQRVTVRRRPGLRRALQYDEADKLEWKFVPQGRESWQQFFSDSQVAKLVTPSIAIFSAYDHDKKCVRAGRFQLCFKVDEGWKCRCPVFHVGGFCVQTRAADYLEAKKEPPLFSIDDSIFEVEPGILWIVEDVGVSYQYVYLRADGMVGRRLFQFDAFTSCFADYLWCAKMQTRESQEALFSRCCRVRAFCNIASSR